MKNAQRDMMCVLLQTLLDKNLIPEDIHKKAREKVLGTFDMPELLRYAEDEREEESHGSA